MVKGGDKETTEAKYAGLTGKQQLFVRAYLGEAGLNATKAAILAGYPEKTAFVVGWENLRKPKLAVLIQQGLNERGLDQPEVLARMANHARGDLDDFLDENGGIDLDKARRRGVTGILREYSCEEVLEPGDDKTGEPPRRIRKQKIRISDPKEYLVTIGKHHKLWTEKHEHGTADGQPLFVINIPDNGRDALPVKARGGDPTDA